MNHDLEPVDVILRKACETPAPRERWEALHDDYDREQAPDKRQKGS